MEKMINSDRGIRCVAAFGMCLLLCLCACDRDQNTEYVTEGSAVTEKIEALSTTPHDETVSDTLPVESEEATTKTSVVELPKIEFD